MNALGVMRVGAIDIGSNSIRLLVADVGRRDDGSGTLVTVARAGEACRLGRGLDRTGLVEDALAEKAGTIAAQFARRARHLGARHLVAAATAAIRSAGNGSDVAARIGERAGVPIRILSGEDEAKLVYRSVILGLGAAARRHSCVVFDLGGGSTEIVSGVGETAGRWSSLPFGAVSLTERHIRSIPPAANEMEALRAEVREHLMQHCAYMPPETPLLAGVGGTVTVLAAIDLGLLEYEPHRIEGWTVPEDRLAGLVRRLSTATHEEKRGWPVLGEGRADIVAAGALAVAEILYRFPAPGLTCSTQGLRYGLARLAADEAAAGDTA